MAEIRRFIGLIGLACLLVAAAFWDWREPGYPESVTGVAEARDGDSLLINRRRIRLIGVDAPEIGQSCMRDGKRWDCGGAAKTHLEMLVRGQIVKCAVTKRDKFARLLAVCRAGSREINSAMVRDGMAVAFGRYRAEQIAAKKAKRGIWAGTFTEPQKWRRNNPRSEAR